MKHIAGFNKDWLDAIFVINFHVDRGQEIEETITWTDSEMAFDSEMLNHVKYHAFPDINMQEMTNMIYCFTYEDYYMYTYFTQQKQINLKRGALQKSVVICTKLKHNWFGMFKAILTTVGPLFIEMGLPIIEDLMQTLGQTPVHERIVLFGNMLYNKCNVLSMFTISDMLTIWELLITGNGLLINGSYPCDCTVMSFGCLLLLDPLEIDVVPYYTIHQKDIKEHQQYKNSILAVANPFLVSKLNWPNILTNKGLSSSFKTIFPSQDIQLDDEFSLKLYFYNLNEKFVQPINSFLNMLLPNIVILMKHVHLKSFQIAEFLKYLDSAYIPISKEFHIKNKDIIEVYKQFVKTAMFTRYLSRQISKTENLLRFRYLELLATFNLQEWASKKTELEFVELLIKIREVVTLFDPKMYTVEDERSRTSSAPPVMYSSLAESISLVGSPNSELTTSPEGDLTVQIITREEPLQRELKHLLKRLSWQTDRLIALVPHELHSSLPKIPFDKWI
eukprot:NODE_323_length_10965_cov_0.441561.p1 type:complete len:504 gc:universal NODE_323_length_10965_cov_0.441561:1202-2713(+)